WVVLLIGVTVAAGNGLTGSSSGLVLGLVAANLTQTLIAAHGLEHWLGHVRGCGGDELLVRVTDVVRILAVVLAACLPAAVVGVVTLDLVGTPVGLTTLITWLGRNAVGMLCVVAIWLLVLRPRAATGRSRREALVAACFGSRRERLSLRVLELVVLLALTVAPWGRVRQRRRGRGRALRAAGADGVGRTSTGAAGGGRLRAGVGPRRRGVRHGRAPRDQCDRGPD